MSLILSSFNCLFHWFSAAAVIYRLYTVASCCLTSSFFKSSFLRSGVAWFVEDKVRWHPLWSDSLPKTTNSGPVRPVLWQPEGPSEAHCIVCCSQFLYHDVTGDLPQIKGKLHFCKVYLDV